MPNPVPAVSALLLVLSLAACVPSEPPLPSGAEDFASYCAACHGASGTGNGALATTLSRRPADLTKLAARNGGTFPTTRVMAKIWGYTGGKTGSVMPNFGPLLEGDTMPYDGGDGIETPTPIRLVQLAEHVKGLGAESN